MRKKGKLVKKIISQNLPYYVPPSNTMKNATGTQKVLQRNRHSRLQGPRKAQMMKTREELGQNDNEKREKKKIAKERPIPKGKCQQN